MGVRLWTINRVIQYLSGITIRTFSCSFHYISDGTFVHVTLYRALSYSLVYSSPGSTIVFPPFISSRCLYFYLSSLPISSKVPFQHCSVVASMNHLQNSIVHKPRELTQEEEEG